MIIDYTFSCKNHIESSDSYIVVGTRTERVNVIYIPLRTIRVKRYNASIYIQNASVKINDIIYTSDSDGNVTYRGGEAISCTITATGYRKQEFSFAKVINDYTNTIELYPLVDVKFIVKDDTGSTVPNAVISCNGETGETNQYGECIFPLGADTYEYTVTHETHFSKSGTVYVSSYPISVDVLMELKLEFLKPVENGNIQILISGVTASIQIGVNEASEFNIDWGDGEIETKSLTRNASTTCRHDYSVSGIYQVEISNCIEIRYCSVDKNQLVAFWSIGDSKVENLSFFGYSKLKYCGDVFKNDYRRNSVELVFKGCLKLQYADLSSFPLMTNVKKIDNLFYDCKNLLSIDLSPLGLMTQLESIRNLLYNCNKLKTVNLSPLSTLVNVKDIGGLLEGCYELISIDLSPLASMVNVVTLTRLLYDCRNLTSIDLTPLSSLVNVLSVSSMLSGCSKLESVDLTPLSSMTKLGDMSYLLYNCIDLKSVHFPDISQMNALSNIQWLFRGCIRLTTIIGDVYANMNIKYVSSFMEECSSYSSALPRFWESYYGRTITKTNCFKGCIKATNWSEVPVSWGGNAEEWFPEYNNTASIKIFKDNHWWLNQSVVIAGITFAQQADGTYSALLTGVRDMESVPVFVNEVQIGIIKIDINITDYMLLIGDTSGMYEGVYIDFTSGDLHEDKVTSNDGWTYDSEIEALKSNKISANSSASIVVSTGIIGEATIIYGQSSEYNSDYCTIYNSTGTKLLDLKGISYQGDDLEIKLTTTDGILKFTYHKDGSVDTGKDAVWIKTISSEVLVLPPLPSDFIPNSMLSGVVRADYRALDTRLKVVESKLNKQ